MVSSLRVSWRWPVYAAALGLVGIPAAAEPRRDPAAAEALFQAAKADLRAGDWAAGCAKLEASQSLDPSVSTTLKLARCREHDGRLAEAYALYHQALRDNAGTAVPSRREALQRHATKALEAIEPRVPRLVIEVDPAPPGLSVLRDGVPIPVQAFGGRLPVDVGTHRLLASAPGHETFEAEVTLAEGEQRTLRITLQPVVTSAAHATEQASEPRGPAVPASPANDGATMPRPSRGVSSRATPGVIGLGAVGVVALAGAAYFGGQTLSKVHASGKHCSEDDVCTREGVALREEASRSQRVGLALLGVSALAFGGATVVWMSATAERDAASLRVTGLF